MLTDCALIDSEAGLHALRPEWEALWRRVPATPFQSPGWLFAWWQHFGTGRPRIAVLRGGDGALLGVLPLYLLGEGSQAKLLPIGIGVSDYLDVLLDPGLPEKVCTWLLASALRRAGADGVAVCDLTDLPPGSPLRTAPLPADWQGECRDADPCPVLPLASTGLDATVPRGQRHHLRLARHRAARIGGWSTEIAGPETVQTFLDALVDLHRARWHARGGGVIDERVAAFHRAAAPALLQSGSLRLQALRFGQRIAAIYYAMLAGTDRIMFYLSGFDASHARESPGTILLGHMIEQAIREGRRELHFLRGAEAYKYAWGGVDRMNAMRPLRAA